MDKPEKMIVAVTGASGHVGSNLVRALLKQGRQVRVLAHHDSPRSLAGLDLQVVHGDVRDPYSLMQLLSGVEIVYHLAAVISLSLNSWNEVEAVNVTGTRNLIEDCQKCGIRRLVHFSSIHAVHQEPSDGPLEERSPLVDPADCSPYERSKAASELIVREGVEQGLDAVILNPTAVIGPDDYTPSLFGGALLDMVKGKLPALVEGGFDWVDVRDVVSAALQAEVRAPQGARYFLSGCYATLGELARLVHEISGSPVPRLIAPHWLARTGVPVLSAFNRIAGNRHLFTLVTLRTLANCHPRISHERASRDLGFQPRPLHDTLVDTIQWFRQDGRLPSR
jgi:dihydroflavonol-4-reductase